MLPCTRAPHTLVPLVKAQPEQAEEVALPKHNGYLVVIQIFDFCFGLSHALEVFPGGSQILISFVLDRGEDHC